MFQKITAFDIAQRFNGVKEVNGATANPQVLAMLRLDSPNQKDDETPWCSAFVNYIAWILRLPRSKDLMARSWLTVGQSIAIESAEVGFDIVILSRGDGVQPGADVLDAPGHVGFFAGWQNEKVMLLGGNQSDAVNVSSFDKSRILSVRRLVSFL